VKFLDLTLPTPAENLACDEALLDLCENERVEVIRFWESREPFVVVGYGNHVTSEVNVAECRRRGVPILRRCSGGGSVVQGPGCLNYNLTLNVTEEGPFTTVTGTNEFVMERNRAALEELIGVKISVQGHTDLAFAWSDELRGSPFEDRSGTRGTRPSDEWLKFSGNAQRRRRNALVLHGTILHAFDLSLLDVLLRFPSAQPEYRDGRTHAEFVRNISAEAHLIREALRSAWQAHEAAAPPSASEIERLVREQYANESWNFRR
jgi:lipoate---protein ligase